MKGGPELQNVIRTIGNFYRSTQEGALVLGNY